MITIGLLALTGLLIWGILVEHHEANKYNVHYSEES